MISSTSNSQVRHVQSLVKKAKLRKEEGLFVVEGIRMFEELPMSRLHKVYVSERFLADQAGMSHTKTVESKGCCELLRGIDFETVTDEVLKAMSDTQTPQGILALVRRRDYTLKEVLESTGKTQLLILETIQDPGNLGTILRAGEGAGITGVILNSGTADIYNPKVIRSTMGSIYRVPFVYVEDLKKTLSLIRQKQIRLFAAHLNGRNNYDEEDYTDHIGFLIGNEAGGLTDETASYADALVKIPMAGQVESLNAAVASSILVFEAARQRRHKIHGMGEKGTAL